MKCNFIIIHIYIRVLINRVREKTEKEPNETKT